MLSVAMAAQPQPARSHTDYTVACICPMGVELAPVRAMLDHEHAELPMKRDLNSYTLGDMAGHNVVIAVLPEIGTSAAATVATQLMNDFPAVRFGLLVGIGGGIPTEDEEGHDIRLGDVVVSKPTNAFGGVVQYDLGKALSGGGFQRTGVLNKPPALLRSTVEKLAAEHRMKGSQVPLYLTTMIQKYPAMEEEYSHPGSDILFRADYPHAGGKTCRDCDKQYIVDRDERRNNKPKFHYGTIGSANVVVKDSSLRERLRQEMDLMCIEMEAAGLMDSFPCLVIRGICDYADSHKNKKWQPYAAATAAAYMKELLSVILPVEVNKVPPATKIVYPDNDRGFFLRQRFLDSLRYPDMNARLNEIRPAAFRTLEWIFEPEPESEPESEPEPELQPERDPIEFALARAESERRKKVSVLHEWFASEGAIFFVEGKAGSGKSTFLKFLYQHQHTQSSLQKWSNGDLVTLVFHSFWLLGTKDQNSLKGFLASLLQQIFSKRSFLLENCDYKGLYDTKSHLSDWSVAELSDLIYYCLDNISEPLCLFLDGIDEFDQDDDIDRFLDFVGRLPSATARLKICLSSRPLLHIVDRFKATPGLRLQDLNGMDIQIYVRETLTEKLGLSASNHIGQDDIQKLVWEVRDKADGVFIWVYFALENVCRGIRIKDDLDDLFERIRKLPSKIGELYSHMWHAQNLDNEIHASESWKLFTAFSLSRSRFDLSVPLMELIAAMDEQLLNEYLALPQPRHEQSFNEICSKYADRFIARSAGLLECVSREREDSYGRYPGHKKRIKDRQWASWGPRGPDTEADSTWRCKRIQFIHRSVYDFLRDTEEGRKIIGVGTQPAKLQDSILLSRLVGFIEDLKCFEMKALSNMINDTQVSVQEPSRVLQLLELTCQSLVVYRGASLGIDAKHWSMHLPFPYDRRNSKNSERFIAFSIDSPGFLASCTDPMIFMPTLLKDYSSEWSGYYKAYVLCGMLTQVGSYVDNISHFLDVVHMFVTSGADLEAQQLCYDCTEFFTHRSTAVQLLITALVLILDCCLKSSHLVRLKGILEIVGQYATKREYFTFFHNSKSWPMWISDWQPHISIIWPKEAELGKEDNSVVIFNAHEVHDAVHRTLCRYMANGYENWFQPENASRTLLCLLRDLHPQTYSIVSHKKASDKGIWVRRTDSAYLFQCLQSLQASRFKSDAPVHPPPPELSKDLQLLKLEDVEHIERFLPDWVLQPLNPSEELGPHEWKEKGVLRDYYAKLRQLKTTGIPIQVEELMELLNEESLTSSDDEGEELDHANKSSVLTATRTGDDS